MYFIKMKENFDILNFPLVQNIHTNVGIREAVEFFPANYLF